MKKVVLLICFIILLLASLTIAGPWNSGGSGSGGGSGNVTLANVTVNALCTAKDTAGNINCTQQDISSIGHLLIKDASGRYADAAVSSPLVYSSGNLSITAGIPNGIIQWSDSKYPAGDGSLITNVDAANVTGLTTDLSGAGNLMYKNSGGNVDNLYLSAALSLVSNVLTFFPANAGIDVSHVSNALSFNGSNTVGHVALIGATNTITDGGTIASLNVRDVASIGFADSATAITVSSGKTGFVVPAALNGMSVAAMTCRVIDQNGANANVTTINLDKNSAGNLTTVFDTAATIGNADYFASAASPNATNAAVLTGDLLTPNVTAIADPAPKGLICTILTQ